MLLLTKGWEHDQIKEIVREALEETVEPIIYAEALDLIEAHRAAGYKVYLVSASPEVIVEPLAEHLGVDGAIASRPVVDDDGRYTGEMEFYAYGPFKAEAIEELARQEGLDLEESSAYSDSYTDLPMLEAVGHPVVVNPDRVLAKVARRARLGGDAVHQAGAPARPGQRPQLVLHRSRGGHHGRGVSGCTGRLAAGPEDTGLAAGARLIGLGFDASRGAGSSGGAGGCGRRPTAGDRVAQEGRSRLAATTPRATTMARIRSFFMSRDGNRSDRHPASGRFRARRVRRGAHRGRAGSDGQEVARAGVRRGMPQLGHGPRLDLTDPLAGQVEVLAHLLERPRLAAIEAEAQPEDLALALVER